MFNILLQSNGSNVSLVTPGKYSLLLARLAMFSGELFKLEKMDTFVLDSGFSFHLKCNLLLHYKISVNPLCTGWD